MTTFFIVVLGIAVLLLIMELCTTGLELLSRRAYKGVTDAVVVNDIRLEKPQSKGLVEESSDGVHFERVKTTEDREAGYFPFQFLLFEKGRRQYVFQWSAGGKTYHGHYRHLKRKEIWKPGQSITLRYKESQPWKFVIDDPAVMSGFCFRLASYVILIVGAIAFFPAA